MPIHAGDGVAIEHEPSIHIESAEDAELLLFDLRSRGEQAA